METYTLAVEKRVSGKKGAKAAKKREMIPVIIYGPAVETNISGSVLRRDFVKVLRTPKGKNVYLTLDVEGEKLKALPFQFEIHPVKHNIQHIDFLAVNDDDFVEAKVPVERSKR